MTVANLSDPLRFARRDSRTALVEIANELIDMANDTMGAA